MTTLLITLDRRLAGLIARLLITKEPTEVEPEPETDAYDPYPSSLLDTCEECGEPLTEPDDPMADPQHVFCDVCGRAEHPADLTTDWNGETGTHRSCEGAVEALRPFLQDPQRNGL